VDNEKYFVYMLESLSKRHYIGITTDPQRRLVEHNAGSTTSTRGFCPWKMIYTEEFNSRSEACKREWHLKHAKGREEKLDIIEKHSAT
jgi:putative endonuclease